MTRRARLLLIGEAFPILIKDSSHAGRYQRLREVVIERKNIEIDLGKVAERVKELQAQYPDLGFYFERHMVVNDAIDLGASWVEKERRQMAHRMVCWIFGRRNVDRQKRRRDVPIYWSSRFRRLYVPKSYWDRNKRLTRSAILYRLRDLTIPHRIELVKEKRSARRLPQV